VEADAPRGVELKHRKIVLRAPRGTGEDKRQTTIDAWYRGLRKDALPPLITKWEHILGVKVKRFFVQKMKQNGVAAIRTLETSGLTSSLHGNHRNAWSTSSYTKWRTCLFVVMTTASPASWTDIYRIGDSPARRSTQPPSLTQIGFIELSFGIQKHCSRSRIARNGFFGNVIYWGTSKD